MKRLNPLERDFRIVNGTIRKIQEVVDTPSNAGVTVSLPNGTTALSLGASTTLGTAANSSALTLGGTDFLTKYAHILDFGSNDAPDLTLQNSSASTGGPRLVMRQDSASPADNDDVGAIYWYGDSDNGTVRAYASVIGRALDVSNATEDAELLLVTKVAGSDVAAVSVANGLIVGAPTNGFKGTGTINAAGDIYKNDGAYANPDFVLEHWATGKIERFKDNEGASDYIGLVPVEMLESELRSTLRLPGITDEPMGTFARHDFVLAKLEEAFIYITQLHNRIAALEHKLNADIGPGPSLGSSQVPGRNDWLHYD